eukprot:m.108081 g.108081  ORF g.108081 m.108081 type:complete len:473 (-) comp9185_c0_seq1:1229-2647(-)
MSNEITKKAIEMANKAIEQDKAENYEEALELYTQAINYMLKGMKYESDQVKDVLRVRTSTYVERAEILKKMLRGGDKKKKKAVPQGGSSGRKSDADSDEEDSEVDPEQRALRRAIESAVVMETPNVAWSDVAGLEGAKEALQEAVILPMRLPHMFQGKREPWHGILLYGPPGTGKSYLAKAVATQVAPKQEEVEEEEKKDGEESNEGEVGEKKTKKKHKSSFISVSSSDLVSKWQGQSEKLVKELFELARENATDSPCVVFVDEIDSLCSARSDNESESSRRIKTEFLVQMQGVGKSNGRVLVVGATNIPWQLDSAIRRRFEKRIYIPLPGVEARRTIFELNLKGMRHTIQNSDLFELAKDSEGYSGSDIANVVREAIMAPVRKVQHATAFTPCDDQGRYQQGGAFLTPVSPNFRGEVIRQDWMSLDGSKLIEPAIDMNDLRNALLSTKKSVDPRDLEKIEEFTREFGQSAV